MLIKNIKVTIELDLDNEKQTITLYSSKKQNVFKTAHKAICKLESVKKYAKPLNIKFKNYKGE